MDDSAAYLECRCGACRVTLCDPRVRFRIECLCFDCRQRVLISSHAAGRNDLPEALENYERGVDLYYFANALRVDEASAAQLEFSKLRPDAFNTTASARCCETVMFGANPAFEGRAIWATPDTCRLCVPTDMPPQFYLFAEDFPVEKLPVLPLSGSIPVLGSGAQVMQSSEVSTLLVAVRAALDTQHTVEPYTTFEQLHADQEIRINNAYFDPSRGVSKAD